MQAASGSRFRSIKPHTWEITWTRFLASQRVCFHVRIFIGAYHLDIAPKWRNVFHIFDRYAPQAPLAVDIMYIFSRHRKLYYDIDYHTLFLVLICKIK